MAKHNFSMSHRDAAARMEMERKLERERETKTKLWMSMRQIILLIIYSYSSRSNSSGSSGSISLRISIQMQFWKITQNRLATFDGKVRKSIGWRWLTDLADCRGTCWFYPGCLSIWLSAVDCRWWLQLCVARCPLPVACCSLLVVCCRWRVCLFWSVCCLLVNEVASPSAWQRLHVACLPGNIWCFNDKIRAIDFSGVSNSLSSESVTASRHLQWQPVWDVAQKRATCIRHQAPTLAA